MPYTYPLTPDSVRTIAKDRDILLAGGGFQKEQRRGRSGGGNPKRRFEVLHNHISLSDWQTLLQFFDDRGGAWESFSFEDPSTGTTYTVRFEADILSVEKPLGRSENPRFTIRLNLREVPS